MCILQSTKTLGKGKGGDSVRNALWTEDNPLRISLDFGGRNHQKLKETWSQLKSFLSFSPDKNHADEKGPANHGSLRFMGQKNGGAGALRASRACMEATEGWPWGRWGQGRMA